MVFNASVKTYWISEIVSNSILLTAFWVWGTKSSHTVTNLVSTQDGQGLGPILMLENCAWRYICEAENSRGVPTTCLAFYIEITLYEIWPANVASRIYNIVHSSWSILERTPYESSLQNRRKWWAWFWLSIFAGALFLVVSLLGFSKLHSVAL